MNLVTVACYRTEWEASLAVNLLERHGIAATCAGLNDRQFPQSAVWGSPQIDVAVVIAEADLQRATELLSEAARPDRPRQADRLAEVENQSPLMGVLRWILLALVVVIVSFAVYGGCHAVSP